jgi:transcriptional regulator with GAF, ATPase, and Fis domain
MQDWKLQDKIKEALTEANGDVDEAAKKIGMKGAALARKIKKWGMKVGVE